MERKNSSSRIFYTPTSAARIANVRNKRETILLAKASKGLSCASDGTLRSFYREKAKAIIFLQRVHSRSRELKANLKANEQVTNDGSGREKRIIVSRTELRDRVNVQRTRRVSLDVNRTEETQRRVQEFLSKDIPGDQPSKNKRLGELSGWRKSLENVARDFQDLGLIEKSSTSEEIDTQPPPQKPFRVRARASGISFACSHGHFHRLSCASAQYVAINCSEEYPMKSSQVPPLRKISIPAKFNQMPLDINNSYDVSNPCPPSPGRKIGAPKDFCRTNMKSASIKKHHSF